MSDDEILALFLARDESAVRETQKKYGKYILQIAKNILGNKNDAEECENDVYLKLWNSIPPQRPSPLKPYLAAVCRGTALDLYDKKVTAKRGGGQTAAAIGELEETLALSGGEDLEDLTALRDAMKRFVDGLPPLDRAIFIRRYWYLCPVKDIAKEMRVSENYVFVLLHRIRRRLKDFLVSEGFDL